MKCRGNEKILVTSQVTHSSGLKMNFKENKTAKSYFSWSLSSFLGFWVVLEPFWEFFGSPSSSPSWKKVQRSPNTHDSTRSRVSRENRKALEFCFGRAKVEHYSIVLSQSKRNRSLLTRCLSRENINLPPFTYAASVLRTHFSQTSVTRPVRANGQEQKHPRPTQGERKR